MRALGKTGWLGTDMPVLRHESMLSVFLRFAFLNQLSASLLKSIWTTPNMQGPQQFKTIWGRGSPHRFTAETGWIIPAADESLLRKLHVVLGWVKSRFRYCPLCLEGGFHSIWHQFEPLGMCPLHNVGLVTGCMSCGEEIGGYYFSPGLLDAPYLCEACEEPICGVAPSIEAIYQFRTVHQMQLESAWAPFSKWIDAPNHAIHQEIENGSRLHGHSKWDRRWNARELLRHMAVKIFPLPNVCSMGSQETTILAWRIKRSDAGHAWTVERRLLRGWDAVPNTVYRYTLYRLMQWISPESCLAVQPLEEFIANDRPLPHALPVNNIAPKALAFWCLRMQFELKVPEQDIARASLYAIPGHSIRIMQGRHFRLSCRATFLSAYAIWYHRIMNARASGVNLEFNMHQLFGSAWTPTLINRRAGMHHGMTCFPTVPGMPLFPFDRISGRRRSTFEMPEAIAQDVRCC